MHQNAPFPLRNQNIFWGGGTAPSSDPLSEEIPLQTAHNCRDKEKMSQQNAAHD